MEDDCPAFMTFYFVQEKNTEPILKKTRLMTTRMVISEDTWARLAPSLIIFLAADKKWVKGSILAIDCTQVDDPSMENQTSDKNIMGQQIKLIIPLVNSSLVPLQAKINPKETRQIVPARKTIKINKMIFFSSIFDLLISG